MTTKEILIKAKNLIPDYEHWSTGIVSAIGLGAAPYGFGGKTKTGELCFCAHGAISVAAGDSTKEDPDITTSDEGIEALMLLADAIAPDRDYPASYNLARDVVEDFNDRQAGSLEELHKAFDVAIAKAD